LVASRAPYRCVPKHEGRSNVFLGQPAPFPTPRRRQRCDRSHVSFCLSRLFRCSRNHQRRVSRFLLGSIARRVPCRRHITHARRALSRARPAGGHGRTCKHRSFYFIFAFLLTNGRIINVTSEKKSLPCNAVQGLVIDRSIDRHEQ
jgi:hypothetical protein